MRLLLDAHVSPTVARNLQEEGLDAVAVSHWRDGNYRNTPDDQLLSAALREEGVLVTYDCRTIPLLLRDLAETEQHHAGVVLVDERTVPPDDIGGLLRSLRALAADSSGEDWRDRVVYLRAYQAGV